ncbi:MAG TPA: STAS domain-containing protein [Chlamydiales bacterium]|nr:STAS domain-containing protein [Chlamydiales bacterium]
MLGLQIKLEEIEEVVVLRIEGRLDLANAPLLERKIDTLIGEKRLKLALDFSGVDYLSSAGMRVLLSKTKQLQSKGGALVLFSIGSEVEEILKIAGFDRILAVYPTEKEALQTLH